MSKADEPAYPAKISHPNGMTKQYDGLTKREYFAAMFAAAVTANASTKNATPKDVAGFGCALADALIAALEREPE